MLYYETIDPTTLELLKSLQNLTGLENTRLVGGTALALQLGHRKSVDLDLFGDIALCGEEIRSILSPDHSAQVLKESPNINIYLIDGIKVDIVNYSYDWIDAMKSEDAEADPMPEMLVPVNWDKIKKTVIQAVKAYL